MISIPKLLPSDPKKSCNICNQLFCAQCGITGIREGPSSAVIEFKMIDRFKRKHSGIICPAYCCCKGDAVLEFVKLVKRLHRETIYDSVASIRIKFALTAGERVLGIIILGIIYIIALVHVHLYGSTRSLLQSLFQTRMYAM